MSQNNLFSILEFSHLVGISRDNLRFYDRIGLLSPEMRGANGYRYYTKHQLGTAYLVGNFRLLGVGLDDIKQFSTSRTPEKMIALFEKQEEYIQREIEKLREISEIMKLYVDMARDALAHGDEEFVVEARQAKERIYLCPLPAGGISEDRAELFAYQNAQDAGINLGSPLGVQISNRSLETGTIVCDHQYYFKTSKKGNAWKPEGLCATVYSRSDPANYELLYLRLLEFARKQNLVAVGSAYGEFLLDEFAVQDAEHCYVRIELPVEQGARL